MTDPTPLTGLIEVLDSDGRLIASTDELRGEVMRARAGQALLRSDNIREPPR